MHQPIYSTLVILVFGYGGYLDQIAATPVTPPCDGNPPPVIYIKSPPPSDRWTNAHNPTPVAETYVLASTDAEWTFMNIIGVYPTDERLAEMSHFARMADHFMPIATYNQWGTDTLIPLVVNYASVATNVADNLYPVPGMTISRQYTPSPFYAILERDRTGSKPVVIMMINNIRNHVDYIILSAVMTNIHLYPVARLPEPENQVESRENLLYVSSREVRAGLADAVKFVNYGASAETISSVRVISKVSPLLNKKIPTKVVAFNRNVGHRQKTTTMTFNTMIQQVNLFIA